MLPQGMDWLVEKVKNPIQRDADYYYHRAAELRFLGAAGTPTFKDAEDDLVKAVEVSRLNQQARGAQAKRGPVRPPLSFIRPFSSQIRPVDSYIRAFGKPVLAAR